MTIKSNDFRYFLRQKCFILSIKAFDKLISISEESKLSDIKISVDSKAKTEVKYIYK